MELVQKINDETEKCSPEMLMEILDFIYHKKCSGLETYTSGKNINQELSNLADLSLHHLENEFSCYQKRYPREQPVGWVEQSETHHLY